METEQTLLISNKEIHQDIVDTQAEIMALEEERRALGAYLSERYDRMKQLRYDAKPNQIERRRKLIEKLNQLLQYRAQEKTKNGSRY